jgi:hypothetical protein
MYVIGIVSERCALSWLETYECDAVTSKLRESAQQVGAQRPCYPLVRRNNQRAPR